MHKEKSESAPGRLIRMLLAREDGELSMSLPPAAIARPAFGDKEGRKLAKSSDLLASGDYSAGRCNECALGRLRSP
jgi:hypothetical protein